MKEQNIWRTEDLTPFCQSERDDVRRWAIERLGNHASADALRPVYLELLEHSDPTSAEKAIEGLIDIAQAEDTARLEIFKQRSDIADWAKGTAVALLAAFGDRDARQEILESTNPDREAWLVWELQDPEGFASAVSEKWEREQLPSSEFLVLACIRSRQTHLAGHVVRALPKFEDKERQQKLANELIYQAGLAGLPRLPEPHNIEWRRRERPASLPEVTEGAITNKIQECLEQLRGVRRNGSVREFGNSSLESCLILDDMIPELPDSTTLQWAREVSRAFRDVSEGTYNDELRAEMLFGLFTAISVAAPDEIRLSEEMTVDRILEAARIDRGAYFDELGERLSQHWATLDESTQEEKTTEIASWLDESQDPFQKAGRFQFVAELHSAELESHLEDFIRRWGTNELNCRPGFIRDKVEQLMTLNPEVWKDSAVDFLTHPNPDVRHPTLDAFEGVNQKWASRAVTEAYDKLVKLEDSRDISNLLKDLGDPETLPTALDLWQPGEPHLAKTVEFLAHIGGQLPDIDDRVLEDAEKQVSRVENMKKRYHQKGPDSNILDLFGDEPLPFALKCGGCKRTYTYGVDKLYIDLESATRSGGLPSAKECDFDRTIECKYCEARDNYEMADRSTPVLLAAFSDMLESGKPATDRVVPFRMSKHHSGGGDRGQKNSREPYEKSEEDVGRNDPCPCGSGRKYKQCCLRK